MMITCGRKKEEKKKRRISIVVHTYPPMKMEDTECSETLVFNPWATELTL
jgi:hypothetical protein